MPQSLQAPGESREAPTAGEIEPSPPAPCALQTFAERVGDRAGERARGRSHPSARAFATVAAGGYAAVTALVVALGLLLTHGPLSGSIGGRDDWATSWLADHRSGAMDGITKVLSLSADTIGAIGIAFVVAIVFAFGRRWQAIAALVVGLTLELLVFLTANYVVGRPRPDVLKMGTEPSTSSFPSGHTAATTVIYVLVAVVVTASTTRHGLAGAGMGRRGGHAGGGGLCPCVSRHAPPHGRLGGRRHGHRRPRRRLGSRAGGAGRVGARSRSR